MKIILLVLFVVALIWAWIEWELRQIGKDWSFAAGDAAAVLEHIRAANLLIAGAAANACTGAAHFEQAARDLGWRVERVVPPFSDGLTDPRAALALNIWVSPPVPFAKIDYVIYEFDDAGCFMPHP